MTDSPARINGHRQGHGHLPAVGAPTVLRPTGIPTTPADRPTDRADKLTPGARRILTVVAVALGLVIVAPVALSSQDLYDWGQSPTGLDLPAQWPLLVPVALDLAAAACIGMTIVSAWRRERPGVFSALVWVFAGASAVAQYRHGVAAAEDGRAFDAQWAMPAFALLGPLLLEVTLTRIRRWARQDTGEQHTGAAGFGIRWLPGVAFRETLAAWAASRREGIATAAEAIQHVRDRKAISGLPSVEAARYAAGAIAATAGVAPTTVAPHKIRVWLSVRGRQVDHAAIAAVTDRPTDRTDRPAPVAVDKPAIVAVQSAPAVRSPVAPASPAPVAPRRAPTAKPARTDKPTPAADRFTPAAVDNARHLRERFGDTLPTDSQGRQATGWSYDRYTKARAAYEAGADKETS